MKDFWEEEAFLLFLDDEEGEDGTPRGGCLSKAMLTVGTTAAILSLPFLV